MKYALRQRPDGWHWQLKEGKKINAESPAFPTAQVAYDSAVRARQHSHGEAATAALPKPPDG